MAEIELLRVAVAPRQGVGIEPTSLHIRQGEVLVVAGRQHADRSALLDVVEGLTTPDSGKVYVGGQPVESRPPGERDLTMVRGGPMRYSRLVALLPIKRMPGVTGASLRRVATVRANLSAAARASRLDKPDRRLSDIIELLGLKPLLTSRVWSLDDADRRRVAIGVAMLSDPAAILLDDPASGLSTEQREPLVQDLQQALSELDLTTIYATGDRAEAIALGDRIAYLKDGAVQQVGTTVQLAADPVTLEVAKFVHGDALQVLHGRLAEDRLMLPEPGLEQSSVASSDAREVLVGTSTPERLMRGEPGDLLLFDADTGARIKDQPRRGELRLARTRPAAGRFLNLMLADAEGSLIDCSDALEPGGQYDLRLDIGAWRPESIIENAVDHPFPDLPETRAGHWIEVVADADGFDVSWSNARLFLPSHGRSKGLRMGIDLPTEPGSGTLRIALYWKRHLLQTALMHMSWRPLIRGRSHWARIDYSLSDFADVARVPERDLSLLLNDSGGGSHRLIVNQRGDDPFSLRFFESDMTKSLENARKQLLARHRRSDGGTRYDADNAKDWKSLYEDLRYLATVGARLLGAVMSVDEQKRLQARLREAADERPGRVTIQIVQATGEKLLFPWHLVYDIPYLLSADRRPCRFLNELDPAHPMTSFPPRCPYESAHALNVVCPYGFWGFAHWVEMPPTLATNRDLPLCVRPGGFQHPVAVGLSLKLDEAMTKSHLRSLPSEIGPLERCDDSATFFNALGLDERELVYLYCHGRRLETTAYGGLTSLIEIGEDDLIAGDDITQLALGSWGERHWRNAAPLVLINGCATVAMTPVDAGEFVNPFIGAGAAGVIGTEVAIDQPVASEAAEHLLRALLEPDATIGSALQSMRRALMAKGNVMGLGYSAYCSANLTVSCPSTES